MSEGGEVKREGVKSCRETRDKTRQYSVDETIRDDRDGRDGTDGGRRGCDGHHDGCAWHVTLLYMNTRRSIVLFSDPGHDGRSRARTQLSFQGSPAYTFRLAPSEWISIMGTRRERLQGNCHSFSFQSAGFQA